MSRHINLYDPTLLRRREWLSAGNLLLVVSVLLLVLLGWGAWLRMQASALNSEATTLAEQVKLTRDQSVALGTELSNRKPDPKLQQELQSLEKRLAVRQRILSTLSQGLADDAASYAEYLRALARQTVSGLWLTGFSVAVDGSGMELRGRTVDPALLPEYIRRLNREQAFRGHRFAALKVAAPAPAPVAMAPGNAAAPGASATPEAPLFHEFALVPEHSPVAGRAP